MCSEVSTAVCGEIAECEVKLELQFVERLLNVKRS